MEKNAHSPEKRIELTEIMSLGFASADLERRKQTDSLKLPKGFGLVWLRKVEREPRLQYSYR